MSKIKLAIIGMGRMGITQYSIINSSPDIEIVAIADNSSFILPVLSKYTLIKTFNDYNELFEKINLDAVLVCTPPNLHFPIIKKAFEKKLHVFVEKPFTVKFLQSAELARLFLNSDFVNQVGYDIHFNELFCKLKMYLDDQIIGKIVRFKSEMFSCTISKSSENASWRAARDSGGGVIFEMGSHAITLINFLIGKPDKVTGSSMNVLYSKNVEDAASTTFLYKNGIVGTLYLNWCDTSYRKPSLKIEIFGNDGRIVADQYSMKIFLNKSNIKYNFHKGWNIIYITDITDSVPFYVRGNQFTKQIYHFIDCIKNKGIENRCSFIEAANTLEVIENIFNDYEKNGRV
jgi:predicted dehydrogenase